MEKQYFILNSQYNARRDYCLTTSRTLQQKLAATSNAFAVEPHKAPHWPLDVTAEFPSL
jgi:hypothetical protein